MIDPNQIYEKLCTQGKDWAQKDHAASLLEETRKSVRSQVIVEYIEKGQNVSKSEAYAESDPRYIEHIQVMCEARKTANLAQVNYKAAQAWSEAVRTAESTLRAQMSLR